MECPHLESSASHRALENLKKKILEEEVEEDKDKDKEERLLLLLRCQGEICFIRIYINFFYYF